MIVIIRSATVNSDKWSALRIIPPQIPSLLFITHLLSPSVFTHEKLSSLFACSQTQTLLFPPYSHPATICSRESVGQKSKLALAHCGREKEGGVPPPSPNDDDASVTNLTQQLVC